MRVSFKLSRTGSRYRPKPPVALETPDGDGETSAPSEEKVALLVPDDGLLEGSDASAKCETFHAGLGIPASFSLNLFPDGYSIGKPTEGVRRPLLQDISELLHPYDRASMLLFSAIEYGWLPGDIFDEIPCNYSNGTLVCEVWDYRTSLSNLDNNEALTDEFPTFQKVCLRMGMENVVKDMALISVDSWNYNDLMLAESCITKALQPELFLSPKPSLDRLCRAPFPKQLDLGIPKGRQTTNLKHLSELSLRSPAPPHGKGTSWNECIDTSRTKTYVENGTFCSNISTSMPSVPVNVIEKRILEPALPAAFSKNYNFPINSSFSVSSNAVITPHTGLAPDQNIVDSDPCARLKDSAFFLGKRDRCNPQILCEPTGKKPKQETPESNYFHNSESQRDRSFEKEMQHNITLLQKLPGNQSMQHSWMVAQSHPQCVANLPLTERILKLEAQIPSPLDQGLQRGDKKALPGTTLPIPESNKEMKPKQERPDSNYSQNSVSESRTFENEIQKNITLLQKLRETRIMQHHRMTTQNYSQCETNIAATKKVLNLQEQIPSSLCQGVQCAGKKALPETKILPSPEANKNMETHVLNAGCCNSNLQQPLSFISSTSHQVQQNCSGSSMKKNAKKNLSQKRKLRQDDLVSAGLSVHSLASKLGENGRTTCCSTGSDVSAITCCMDKGALSSAGSTGSVYVNSCITNTAVRVSEKLPQVNKKRDTLNKVTSHNIGCLGFPSTFNVNVPVSSKNSLVGAPPFQPLPAIGDPAILERLSRICMVIQRHGLDNKKSTDEKYIPSKPLFPFPLKQPSHFLNLEGSEECTALTDQVSMLKYLIGGSRNICKNRVMTFVRVRCFLRGDGHPVDINPWIKLILFESQKPEDHKIGAEVLFEEGSIPIGLLPSLHYADLLATQFTSLMEREGYRLMRDQIQPSCASFSDPPISNFMNVGPSGVTERTYATPNSVQSLKIDACFGNCISFLDQHQLLPALIPTPRMKTNPCLNLTRRHELEISPHLSSMQQEHLQNLGSSLMAVEDENLLLLSNMQIGCQVPNNSRNSLHLQFLQYKQQRPQQQVSSLSEIARLGGTINSMACGGQDSGLNVDEMSNNLWQMSTFGHYGNVFMSKGNSHVQATKRVKPRDTNLQEMGVVDGMLTETLSDRYTGSQGDGSLLDQTPRKSYIGQLQDKLQICLPEMPYLNLHTIDYGHLKDPNAHQEDNVHHPLQSQHQEQIGSPQQLSSQFVTRKRWSSPRSSK